MSKRPAEPRRRFPRKWTLGGLMLLIAALAIPLALYVRHVREVEQREIIFRAFVEHLNQKVHPSSSSVEIQIKQGVSGPWETIR